MKICSFITQTHRIEVYQVTENKFQTTLFYTFDGIDKTVETFYSKTLDEALNEYSSLVNRLTDYGQEGYEHFWQDLGEDFYEYFEE